MEEWIMQHLGEILLGIFGGATLLQVSPLKIDPWSWLGGLIGRGINAEIMSEVKGVRQELKDHIEEDEKRTTIQDERYIKQCRTIILRFHDELRGGHEPTKEHFDEIMDTITVYNTYCDTHPGYKNEKAKVTISCIKQAWLEQFAAPGHDRGEG